jgi:large subunit ribosomal protein L28
MPRVCHFTNKRTTVGWIRAEKGARRDGGVGNKIKGRSKRKILPNLKKIRCMIDGEVKSVYVSTRALKKGLVVKPFRVPADTKAVKA